MKDLLNKGEISLAMLNDGYVSPQNIEYIANFVAEVPGYKLESDTVLAKLSDGRVTPQNVTYIVEFVESVVYDLREEVEEKAKYKREAEAYKAELAVVEAEEKAVVEAELAEAAKFNSTVTGRTSANKPNTSAKPRSK